MTFAKHRKCTCEAGVQLGRERRKLGDHAGTEHRQGRRTDDNRRYRIAREDCCDRNGKKQDGPHVTRHLRHLYQTSPPDEGRVARCVLRGVGHLVGRRGQGRQSPSVYFVTGQPYRFRRWVVMISEIRTLDPYALEAVTIQKLSCQLSGRAATREVTFVMPIKDMSDPQPWTKDEHQRRGQNYNRVHDSSKTTE